MSSNIINQSPYLPTTRRLPKDIENLVVELDRTNVDTANAVNNRTIGLFPTSRPSINGESWFLEANNRQQGLRQVYTFTSDAAINHGIKFVIPGQFVRCFGEYTDGTKTYGLIYGNTGTAIPGQIVFDITSTQIEFNRDSAAPTIQSGTVVVEWISRP